MSHLSSPAYLRHVDTAKVLGDLLDELQDLPDTATAYDARLVVQRALDREWRGARNAMSEAHRNVLTSAVAQATMDVPAKGTEGEPMTTMIATRAPREICSHELCDMEPCTAFDYMTYEYDAVWGWVTICERCERAFPTLPEQHAEERHDG